MQKIGIVLCDSLPLPPVKGGAVETLLQSLVELNEKDPKVDFVLYSNYDEFAEQQSHRYLHADYLYFKPGVVERLADFCLKVIRKLSRQYLKSLTPSLYEIMAAKAFKKKEINKVVLANCPYFSLSFSKTKDFKIIQYLHNDYINIENIFAKTVLEHSNQVIAVSDFIKRRINEVAPQGLKTDTCYNGLNLDNYLRPCTDDELEELRKKYSLKKSDKVIIYVGRLTDTKGIGALMDAFEQFAPSFPEWKLMIVGGMTFSSSEKDTFVEGLYRKAKSIGHQVFFTGYVDYIDIYKYYQLSDLCVVPSLTNESFSLTSVEAQASGLPVIISDAGGIIETISPKSGMIVNRGNQFVENLCKAMSEIMANEEKRNTMSAAARESANRFPAMSMYERFIELVI